MNNITPQDMMKLQTDNYNVFANMAVPLILKNLDIKKLSNDETKYFDLLKNWNFVNDVHSKGATIFMVTWDTLENKVWNDELLKSGDNLVRPDAGTLLNNLLKDSAFSFVDNINTPGVETLPDIVTIAFKTAVLTIKNADNDGDLEWGKYKDTRVAHLARIEAFSRLHLPIGGGTNTINAANSNHGPSWRMVVSLTPDTQAWGVYPGGQSGNPGSRYYDNEIDTWAKGAYYAFWIMKANEVNDKRVKWKMKFSYKSA